MNARTQIADTTEFRWDGYYIYGVFVPSGLGVYRLFLEFLTEINTTELSPRCTRRQLKKLQLSDTIGPTRLLYEYCSY